MYTIYFVSPEGSESFINKINMIKNIRYRDFDGEKRLGIFSVSEPHKEFVLDDLRCRGLPYLARKINQVTDTHLLDTFSICPNDLMAISPC